VDILPVRKETFLPGSKPCAARQIDHLIPVITENRDRQSKPIFRSRTAWFISCLLA